VTSGGDELFVTIGGKDVGLQALLQRVDAEMSVSANKAVQLGQAYGRLAQAQGKPALASQVLAGTIGQAGAASEKALIGIETQAARVGASSSYFTQFGSAATSQLGSIVGPAAAATAVLTALKGAVDLGIASAKIDATRVSFDHLAASVNTTGDALLNKMRAAAEGTVSDADLIQSANSGLLLTQGKLAADLPRILEISRAAAQATGDDVNFVFNSLVTGIARGSPKIIDNAKITLDAGAAMETYARSIGKSVDQLSAADQQQATLNAVLLAGTDLIKNAGPAADNSSQAFARLGVNLTNAKNSFGSFLSIGLGNYASNINSTISSTQSLIASVQQLGTAMTPAAAASAAFADAIQHGATTTQAAAAADAARASVIAATGGVTQGVTDIEQHRVDVLNATASLSQQAASASIGYANAIEMTGVQARAAAQASEIKGNADQVAAVNAQTHAIAQQKLADAAQHAAQLLLLNGDAGARTAALLAGSSQQVDILTAAYYRLAVAQQVAKAADPLKGVTEDRLTRDTTADRAKVKSDQALASNQKLLASIAKLNNPPKGGGGGTRLSDQTKLQNSLLASQEDYEQKSEDAVAQYTKDVEKINQDFYDKMRAADRDFNQGQLDDRAGFYANQGSIESAGVRAAASAAYEQASVEAGKIAQEKGADVANKYMDAQEKIISDRAKRQDEIEKASNKKDDKAYDPDRAEYLKGVDALERKAEDARIARIQEGEGSIAAERQKQLDDAAAKEAEAQDKIGLSADRAAEKKILASTRSGAQVDAEKLKVDGLAASYDRLGAAGTRAGITPTAAAPSLTPPAGTTAPGAVPADNPMVAALDAIRAAVDAAAAAIVGAERDTTGAVRSLKSSGGIAG